MIPKSGNDVSHNRTRHRALQASLSNLEHLVEHPRQLFSGLVAQCNNQEEEQCRFTFLEFDFVPFRSMTSPSVR